MQESAGKSPKRSSQSSGPWYTDLKQYGNYNFDAFHSAKTLIIIDLMMIFFFKFKTDIYQKIDDSYKVQTQSGATSMF